MSSEWTVEEVRQEIDDSIHSGGYSGLVAIANAYADSLERRAEGVTDAVVERACASLGIPVSGDDPYLDGENVRAALLAVWPVAAEPVAPTEPKP